MKQHIWQGQRINNDLLEEKLSSIEDTLQKTLDEEKLDTEDLLDACESLSKKITENSIPEFKKSLISDGCDNPDEVLKSLSDFMTRKSLEIKLKAELGSVRPFEVRAVDFVNQNYETWAPMGVLTHITAGNSPDIAPMATIEGLLSGNINLVKVASNIGLFSLVFLEKLSSYSNLGKFIYMFSISSSQREYMQKIIDMADCVSAWGGDQAISAITGMTPAGIPVVTWGHKISFSYLTEETINNDTIDALVKNICTTEQQFCSSPQCVMIDTENIELLHKTGHLIAERFDNARNLYPVHRPDIAEAAEITTVSEVYKADLFYHGGEVIQAKDNLYRVLIDDNAHFAPSPLFRTIWVSPLPHNNIVKNLRPLRKYLQTCGLACTISQIEGLSDKLYRAGVTRITSVESMAEGYIGEPHDGGYALPKFLKRVSLSSTLPMKGIVSFNELKKPKERSFPKHGLQNKSNFPDVPQNGTRVVMKSGGTSGEPVYCSYSAKDFVNYIVNPCAQSFLSSGLDIEKDVVGDLLYAGGLYGGLCSLISVFDYLKAPHLNVSALENYDFAATCLIKGRATALLGSPSYIYRLMKESEHRMKDYGRINKIFYAGEAMTKGQRKYFEDTFGIHSFNSMTYGANDTGTMGYACTHCKPGEFHLCSDIQQLEILKMDKDEPVQGDEIGRLVWTGYLKEDGRTERYEIGDMGQWITEDCPCGRLQPRFRLLGRYGDNIRIGGDFFNYPHINKIISDSLNYSGYFQILVNLEKQEMTFCLEDSVSIDQDAFIQMLFDSGYSPFVDTIPTKIIKINLQKQKAKDFIINESSKKFRTIVYLDHKK